MASYSVTAPDGQIITFDHDDNLTDEQILEIAETGYNEMMAAQQPAPEPVAPPPSEEQGTFLGGLERGWKQAVGTGAKGLGDTLGLEDLEQWGEEYMQTAPQAMSFRRDVNDLSSGIDFVQENVGQLGGGLPMYAGAAAAGAKAGAMLPVPPQLKPFTSAGGAILAMGQTYLYGETLMEQEEENKKRISQGLPPHEYDETTTRAYATGQAALEYLGLRSLAKVFPWFNKLLGSQGKKVAQETAEQLANTAKKSRLAGAAKGAGAVGIAESGTELGQTILQRMAAKKDLTGEDAINEYIEVFAATLAGAGPLGGFGGYAKTVKERDVAQAAIDKIEEGKQQIEDDRKAQELAEQEALAAQAALVDEANENGFALDDTGVDVNSRGEGAVSRFVAAEEDEEINAINEELASNAEELRQMRAALDVAKTEQEAAEIVDGINAGMARNYSAQARAMQRLTAKSVDANDAKKAGYLGKRTYGLRKKAESYANVIADPDLRQEILDNVPIMPAKPTTKPQVEPEPQVEPQAQEQEGNEFDLDTLEDKYTDENNQFDVDGFRAELGQRIQEGIDQGMGVTLRVNGGQTRVDVASVDPTTGKVKDSQGREYDLGSLSFEEGNSVSFTLPEEEAPITPADIPMPTQEQEAPDVRPDSAKDDLGGEQVGDMPDVPTGEPSVELAGESERVPTGGVRPSDDGTLADPTGPSRRDAGTKGTQQPTVDKDQELAGLYVEGVKELARLLGGANNRKANAKDMTNAVEALQPIAMDTSKSHEQRAAEMKERADSRLKEEADAISAQDTPENVSALGKIEDSDELGPAIANGDLDAALKVLEKSDNEMFKEVARKARELQRFGFIQRIEIADLPARVYGRTATGVDTDGNVYNVVTLRRSASMDPYVFAHELVHAQTSAIIETLTDPRYKVTRFYSKINTPKRRNALSRIQKLHKAVIKFYKDDNLLVKQEGGREFVPNPNAGFTSKQRQDLFYGITNIDEFMAEGMTNPEFQKQLLSIPYESTTLWDKFVDAIADLLGYRKGNAFYELMQATRDLSHRYETDFDAIPVNEVPTSDTKTRQPPKISHDVKKYKPDPKKQQAARDRLEKNGNPHFEPETGSMPDVTAPFKNPDGSAKTSEDYKKTTRSWVDTIATRVFSSDAAVQRAIRDALRNMSAKESEIIGTLLSTSTSQAYHAEAVASMVLETGGAVFDQNLQKWRAVEGDGGYVAVVKKLDEIARANGLDVHDIESIAHAYLEARRLTAIRNRNIAAEPTIARLSKGTKADKARARDMKKRHEALIIHKTQDQLNAALDYEKDYPELKEVADMWEAMRSNVVDMMTESGLVDELTAEMWANNTAYIPFQRSEQIEDGEGLKKYVEGLVAKPEIKKFTGSNRPVNNLFENQRLWVEHFAKVSVRNHTANRMLSTMEKLNLAENRPATKSDPKNTVVRAMVNGKSTTYIVADPLMYEAFTSLPASGIPMLGWAQKFTNFLRKSVVLNPVFSIGQLTQDAFGAMFSSGLPPSQAIKLPFKVISEFKRTLDGTSTVREDLRRLGAVGVRDYSSDVVQGEIKRYIDSMVDPDSVGKWDKTKRWFEDFSMASDNAVRQAVYSLAIESGASKAEAVERSFEIINFRRKGSHPVISTMVRMIPFFNAYLQAMNVQMKTLAGEGISPRAQRTRSELYKNMGVVVAMTALYTLLQSGDDDYEEMDPKLRDRMLHLGGGFGLPLRTDLFLLPKVLVEHAIRLQSDSETEDPRTFWNSVRDTMLTGLLSPTAVPQIIKPTVEVAFNRSFYTNRDLVPTYLQKNSSSEQYNEYTSEIAKMLGEVTGVSPIKIDHWFRGTFGSAAGAVMWTSNMIGSAVDVRPDVTVNDAAASFPGMSRFMTREGGTGAFMNMLYDGSREAEKIYADYMKISGSEPHRLFDYLFGDDEMNSLKLATREQFKVLTDSIADIRKQKRFISSNPYVSGETRREMLAELTERERNMLKYADLKKLRESVGFPIF